MTATIQQLGEELKAPANETMTETRMCDTWARMGVGDKLFVARLSLAIHVEESGEPCYDLNDKVLAVSDQYMKTVWNQQNLPFKI